MRRIRILVGFAFLALAAVTTSVSNRSHTLAAEWTCKLGSECAGVAYCSGDKWMKTGTCSISCLKETSNAGEFVVVSGANCGGGSGRPPGSTPGAE